MEKDGPKDKESSTSPSDLLNVSRSKKPEAAVSFWKIIIKKFNENPIKWQQFHDTFKATIVSNEYLSDVENFSYLSRLLEGQEYQSLEGFNVTRDAYKRALELLSERYENPQIISSCMAKTLKLQKLQKSLSS